MDRRFCQLLFAFLFGCSALVAAVAESSRRKFDLPAGQAEETLRLFAQQAGGQFVFSSDKVAGVKTRSVKGQFTKQEALDRMLEGTGLKAVRDEETGAFTVDRTEPLEAEREARRPKATSRLPVKIFDPRNGNVARHGLALQAL